MVLHKYIFNSNMDDEAIEYRQMMIILLVVTYFNV